MQSKNDASAFKQKGGAADILNAVNMEVTQEALEKNVKQDLEQTAKVEYKNQLADWEATQKKAQIGEDNFSDDDEFLNDKDLQDLQSKRLADMKKKVELEQQFHRQGHGEYREIVEEEFLKEVCGSQWVVVHFYHHEFWRCKIVDKHMKILAQKHLSCKWLTMDAEKAPFFITKLSVSVLPTCIVFKDGIVEDRLEGFEELGGKDEFRTEVMEHWFSKVGCVIMNKASVQKMDEQSDSSGDGDSDDDE